MRARLIKSLKYRWKKHAIRGWYMNTRHSLVGQKISYPSVLWLSYHIPKTAGSSFGYALKAAFGSNHVYDAYYASRAPARLNEGQPIWIPDRIRVIHGHFTPHVEHKRLFPNAKRIVWIRDPLERSASLMKFVLRTDLRRASFKDFKSQYSGQNIDHNDLLEIFLTDERFHKENNIYKHYLNGLSSSDFAFIGRTESYDDDLKQLEILMGVTLEVFNKNTAGSSTSKGLDRERLQPLLKSEYDFLSHWLPG